MSRKPAVNYFSLFNHMAQAPDGLDAKSFKSVQVTQIHTNISFNLTQLH